MSKKPERRIRDALAMVTLVVCVAGLSLLSPRNVLTAAAFDPAQASEATSINVAAPASRNIVIPATVDSNGDLIPEHLGAHLLFTPTVEKRIKAQGGLENKKTSSSHTVFYHGGPVMEGSPVIYLIFYQPSGSRPFPSGFVSGLARFFTHASGSPFAAIVTQYPDTSGIAAAGTVTVGGVYVDTTTNPSSGNLGTQADPLTDSDIQNEIAVAYEANPSWQKPGLNVLPEVFTAPNIWEEFSPKDVSFTNFCAYHSAALNRALSSGYFPYAYIPYADSYSGICAGSNLIFPDGVEVDSATNLAWHETVESMTDPLINAWYDPKGNEIGDWCSWNYGNIAPNGADSVMNGLAVQVQQIWSNASSACVKTYDDIPDPSIPAFLDFGTVKRGVPTTLNLVIQNTPKGTGVLNILDVTNSSSHGTPFKLTGSSVVTTLQPNGDWSVPVTVISKSAGRKTGKLYFYFDYSKIIKSVKLIATDAVRK